MRYLVIAAMMIACGGAKPCSKQRATELNAECAIRIVTECKANDKTCPTYLECKRKAEQWRTCHE